MSDRETEVWQRPETRVSLTSLLVTTVRPELRKVCGKLRHSGQRSSIGFTCPPLVLHVLRCSVIRLRPDMRKLAAMPSMAACNPFARSSRRGKSGIKIQTMRPCALDKIRIEHLIPLNFRWSKGVNFHRPPKRQPEVALDVTRSISGLGMQKNAKKRGHDGDRTRNLLIDAIVVRRLAIGPRDLGCWSGCRPVMRRLGGTEVWHWSSSVSPGLSTQGVSRLCSGTRRGYR